jgi:hypothetical protein
MDNKSTHLSKNTKWPINLEKEASTLATKIIQATRELALLPST